MSVRHTITRPIACVLTAVLAVAALALPVAATARPVDQPAPRVSAQTIPEVVVDLPEPTVTRTIDDGFDWASAVVGAGVVGVVLLLAAGGAALVTRRAVA